MKITPALIGLLIALLPAEQARSGQGESSRSETCEYMNFVVVRGFPGYAPPDELASEAILQEVENLFSRELERAGFHRVGDGETQSLLLRAILQVSSLSSSAVSGIVELKPSSNLHRDLALALNDGAISEGAVGMIAVGETDIRPAGHTLGSPAALQGQARHEAQSALHKSYPVLSALCEWRAQLVVDGLTVEELQRQLIDGMGRIRREYREGTRQKELKLEVEP